LDTITDFQKMVQIAKMYYNEGYTQEKIAKEFSIARSAVSVLLAEARNVGIVTIHIKDAFTNDEQLADALEERFGLDKCIVVPINTGNSDLLLKIVASQAALFASKIIFSHSSVGMAWGSACYQFMSAFPEDTGLYNISVVPLIGGSPLLSQEFQLNESVKGFAEKLGGTPVSIHFPGLVPSLDDKKRIMETTYMQSIIEKWKSLDFAVLGIGRCPENYTGDNYLYDQVAYDMNRALEFLDRHPNNVIGDLCGRRFNIKGEVLRCEHNKRLIGIDEFGLMNVKRVLAIACGVHKVLPAIGALRTKLIHNFITDENTAKQMLQVADSENLLKIK